MEAGFALNCCWWRRPALPDPVRVPFQPGDESGTAILSHEERTLSVNFSSLPDDSKDDGDDGTLAHPTAAAAAAAATAAAL